MVMQLPIQARPEGGQIQLLPRLEALAIPLLALLAGAGLFSTFLLVQGRSAVEFFDLIWRAGFSTAFSWQNTLTRVSPLLFAALCVAIPARLGLMVIGGEGAIMLGGLAAAVTGTALADAPSLIGIAAMLLASLTTGAVWIGAVGALRVRRGINETITSLLMAYIAAGVFNHFVEFVFRDPASLNKPSTAALPTSLRIGEMPFIATHWGAATGIICCLLCWFLIERTTIGFAARVTGDNLRAAQMQGLPVAALVTGFTALGGALAGLAGFFEVGAIHGAANASLISGAGYTGILVAFVARHNPLAIIPVALLLAGFEAASGLVQRRMDLPDASMICFQGCIFIAVLASETLHGRSHEVLRGLLSLRRQEDV
jgi:ABC-type uncharacterized transport system permease subunit